MCKELVDFLDGRPAAFGDADLALGIDDLGLGALLCRH